MQKSQLVDEAALRKKAGAQRHWILRGRICPDLSDSPADTQAFVGEAVKVTARVAAQIRSLSDIDVALFGPRTGVDTFVRAPNMATSTYSESEAERQLAPCTLTRPRL